MQFSTITHANAQHAHPSVSKTNGAKVWRCVDVANVLSHLASLSVRRVVITALGIAFGTPQNSVHSQCARCLRYAVNVHTSYPHTYTYSHKHSHTHSPTSLTNGFQFVRQTDARWREYFTHSLHKDVAPSLHGINASSSVHALLLLLLLRYSHYIYCIRRSQDQLPTQWARTQWSKQKRIVRAPADACVRDEWAES